MRSCKSPAAARRCSATDLITLPAATGTKCPAGRFTQVYSGAASCTRCVAGRYSTVVGYMYLGPYQHACTPVSPTLLE